MQEIWYVFKDDKLLLCRSSEPRLLTSCDVGALSGLLINKGTVVIGDRDKGKVINEFWGEMAHNAAVPGNMITMGLREVGSAFGEEVFYKAARAFQLMKWYGHHLFCMSCGGRLKPSPFDNGKICPSCGAIFYPPVTPAIIVAVEREGKILLARNANFPPGRYSVIAGFVEPGESFEDAVRREVKEEVSVEVKNIRYFGSQPWPFPHTIMVGFTAQWASGEIKPDGREILDARWFAPDELPDIPSGISISRKLIDHFRQYSI